MKTTIKKIQKHGFKYSIKYVLDEVVASLRRIFFTSYSQRGEDLIINDLLGNKKEGFYVDIGACDPVKINNTYLFYQKGWRGINIEPQEKKYNLLCEQRPEDINLQIGIGYKEGSRKFYEFEKPELSTFSGDNAKSFMDLGYKMIGTKSIQVQKLMDVLSKYCNNKDIDFFSIDAEGCELEVLNSNNWNRFKPKVICLESDNDSKDNLLESKGYSKVCNNGLNSVYVLK